MSEIVWPDLAKILPEGKSGNASVERFTVSETESRMASLHGDYLRPGTYTKLVVDGTIMMSDTQMEKSTNREAIRRAHGHVLIGGLGIGLIIIPMLAKPEVSTITVIEKSQDVIALVEPHIRQPKLRVINCDVNLWRADNGQKFNVIYMDIWPNICTDNLDEINRLHRYYRKMLDKTDPNAWMNSWQADNLRSLRRRGRWR